MRLQLGNVSSRTTLTTTRRVRRRRRSSVLSKMRSENGKAQFLDATKVPRGTAELGRSVVALFGESRKAEAEAAESRRVHFHVPKWLRSDVAGSFDTKSAGVPVDSQIDPEVDVTMVDCGEVIRMC